MQFVFAKIVRDGGKGSGNFGHKGRPGQVGGSSKEGGASSDLLKTSVDLTLADVDDHLAKVGIRKGDVVKAFGLRKDVLLSHAQNCMKAQEKGEFWRGVFKSEADVEEMRQRKAELEANGLTDSKEYIKASRSLARYDFVKGMVDGMQPATAEPPKAEEPLIPEEPVKKEKIKKEKVKKEKVEEPTGADLGEVEVVPSFKAKPLADLGSLFGEEFNTIDDFIDTFAMFTGHEFNPDLPHTKSSLKKLVALISKKGLNFDWNNKEVSNAFAGSVNRYVRNGIIDPYYLDAAVDYAFNMTVKRIDNGYTENDCLDSLQAFLGLSYIKRKQEDVDEITQDKFDSLPRTSTIKSKLTDAGKRGHDISQTIRKASVKNVTTLKLNAKSDGVVPSQIIADLTANFSGVNFIDDGALDDHPKMKGFIKTCFLYMQPSEFKDVAMESFLTATTFDEWKAEAELSAGFDYDECRRKFKNWKVKASSVARATESAIASSCVLAGLKKYEELHGKPKSLSGDVFSRVQALSLMEFLASQRYFDSPLFNGNMYNFLRKPDGSLVSNAIIEYASDKIARQNKKINTTQTNIADMTLTASTKPDLENNLVSTKIGKTNRTGNNLDALTNAFKFIPADTWKRFTKSGERSAHHLTDGMATKTTVKLKDGIHDKTKVLKNKKYNHMMLDATDLSHLLCAMTCGGGYYTAVKEPNRYGSNNLINMMTACGEIVDTKDTPCIRFENMENNYRNYNLKVGDSIMFDAQHASCNTKFANNDALKMFGEEAPCRFEVVGKYPRLDLEPFVWEGKRYMEYEQLMAGFFKVKSVEDNVPMTWEVKNHGSGTVSVKKVQLEFDWDRYDEYLSLQTRGFADYMGMYGEEEPKKAKGK